MVQVSKRYIDQNVWDTMFYLLFETVGRKENRKEFEQNISGILSKSERIMIAKRITIMYLVIKGIDTNTICSVVKVTRTTVAKCSNILDSNLILKKNLQFEVKKDQIVDFLDKIFSIIRPPGTYGTNWKEAWRNDIKRRQKKETGI